MADIKSKRLIVVKGFLFLVAGVLASALLILDHPSVKAVLLLMAAVWCFARFYYFAFYVIEHYVDPSYRFAGLGSFAVYLIKSLRLARSSPKGPGLEPKDQDQAGTN